MKPLFIPLKGEFYDQFEKGQKDTEYRPHGKRWNERTCPVGREVVLSRGYGKARRLRGVVTHFTTSKAITQTGLWRSIYGIKHMYAACIQIRLAPSISEKPGDSNPAEKEWPEPVIVPGFDSNASTRREDLYEDDPIVPIGGEQT